MARTTKAVSFSEDQLSNHGAIAILPPFGVRMTIQGSADLLLHAWSNEAVRAKAEAEKGSKTKKTDDLESYVYRDDDGNIAMPSRYLLRCMQEAGRNFADPTSPRKTARDLVKATVISTETLVPINVNGAPMKTWEYEDQQRVCVMRAAITRTRPAFKKGWTATFNLVSLAPSLMTEDFMRKLVDTGGLLIGLGDFRPSYGRFKVINWELVDFIDVDAA